MLCVPYMDHITLVVISADILIKEDQRRPLTGVFECPRCHRCVSLLSGVSVTAMPASV